MATESHKHITMTTTKLMCILADARLTSQSHGCLVGGPACVKDNKSINRFNSRMVLLVNDDTI